MGLYLLDLIFYKLAILYRNSYFFSAIIAIIIKTSKALLENLYLFFINISNIIPLNYRYRSYYY